MPKVGLTDSSKSMKDVKTPITYFLFILLLFTSARLLAQPNLQLVNIGDFTTTSGRIIKDCKIGYRTVGELNADSSNVILWPTWFGGTSKSIVNPRNLPNWIDSTGFYIIAVDALTDGVSSSPSNTADFPNVTVRDMVNSQYTLLVHHLHIHHVFAVIGISLGGMQAFEWIVAYPDFMDKAIPIIGTPKQSSYDILVWQTQADLIKEAGSNEEDIHRAMKRVCDVSSIASYTPSYFVKEVTPDKLNEWRNNGYSYIRDSRDYLAGLEAMIAQDIYKSASIDPETIANVVKADVHIIVSAQDHLVNPASSIDLAGQLGCALTILQGDCGHVAVWCEADKIKEVTSTFLNQ